MRVIVVLVALVAALAAAMPLQNAMTQDTIVDLTPYFADGLEEGHALLANLTIGYTDAAPSINGRAFSLGSTVTMEVPAALTDMSTDGKVTVQAMVILDAGAYQADLDGMTQIHIQAIIRAVNRVALGAVSAVSEVVITVDSNNNEMSRTQNEIALEDSVLSSVADEVTTDMFEIDVIVITHGKTQQQTEGASPDSSESSDSSDSSESSESSESSDSSESSESSHSFSGHHHQGGHHHDGGDWDEKWEMYESSVRGKIHRALHSACSWFHRQPFYVKASIGFGISLVFFAMFYTCLRCLAPSKPAVATTAPASKASVFGGKVYEYSEKNLDFPLDDLAYETKPLIVFTDDVQRV